MQALFLSLKVLALDVPILFILGTVIGHILAKRKFPGKEVLYLLLLLPTALPPSVMGLYLLMFMGRISWMRELHLLFSFPAAVIAPLVQSLPIMIQAARSGFSSVPESLEDAARVLGDSEVKVFFRISFPLSRRFLFAGAALSSVRVLGDFGVTLMIAGNIPGRTQTLPLYIYNQVESLDFASANTAAAILVVIGIASLLITRRMEGRKRETVSAG